MDHPMDHGMDDDRVLRDLGEALARDDPQLAALLDGSPTVRRRHRARSLLVLLLLTVAGLIGLLLAPTVALGAAAILLALASPLLVCWLCADPPAPRLR